MVFLLCLWPFLSKNDTRAIVSIIQFKETFIGHQYHPQILSSNISPSTPKILRSILFIEFFHLEIL